MRNYILSLCALVFFSCSNKEKEHEEVLTEATSLPSASNVPLSLDMSNYAAEFVTHCQTCHTARYVEMQPKLSRKAWTKTVDKMIHAYGAPIDSLTALKIVDYLVWVKEN